ncbi:MAG TPA: biotin--[acetyl-CoA-carboxylase] ligase [Armatimonadota bacterium]|nr:biotin--[acetyl-CoA-carboxylase] ligase [Armatimonadota bacterium]
MLKSAASTYLDIDGDFYNTVLVMQLNIDEIRRLLGEAYSVEYHQHIDSTNDRAIELARDGAAHGTLVVTDYQAAGRGRRGAVWTAPEYSSILCSIILRPSSPIPNHHLAILTGVGVANGLRKHGAEAKIKWPNDIMLCDRKIAGILVETVHDAVIVGVGINCQIPQDTFPDDVRERAGSLHTLLNRKIVREQLLVTIIEDLIDALNRVEQSNIIKVLYEWNSLNWLSRRKVRVTGPLGSVDGDGLFLDGRKLIFHVFKDYGVVPMPLSSSVEAR